MKHEMSVVFCPQCTGDAGWMHNILQRQSPMISIW